MSQTIVYAAEVRHNDRLKHVMAYQNTAENLAPGPNAMLLPIPAAVDMVPQDTLDMTPAPTMLKEWSKWFEPRSRSVSLSKGVNRRDVDSLHVFNSGSYTVILTQNAKRIQEALRLVPANRRPAISQAMIDAYALLYPGWTVALCCFDGTIEAEPIAFAYEPMYPEYLFLPGLDAHDGSPPNLGTEVQRDHTLMWGSSVASKRALNTSQYKGILPATLTPFFPTYLMGDQVRRSGKNADFMIPIAKMDQGYVEGMLR